MLDPSKLTKEMVDRLWTHWRTREANNELILVFTKARKQDSNVREDKRPHIAGKRKSNPFVDVGSDAEPSNDEPDGCHARKGKGGLDAGEGTSGSSDGPPPFKRPHLSEQPGVPEKHSPASNKGNINFFLLKLAKECQYNTLLFQALELPDPVSLLYFFICINFSNYFYIQALC